MGNVNMNLEGQPTELALKVNERLRKMRGNKAEIAIRYGCSRAMVSQYLNGKYKSDPSTIEEILERFLADTEDKYGDGSMQGETLKNRTGDDTATLIFPEKREVFESSDYMYGVYARAARRIKPLGSS